MAAGGHVLPLSVPIMGGGPSASVEAEGEGGAGVREVASGECSGAGGLGADVLHVRYGSAEAEAGAAVSSQSSDTLPRSAGISAEGEYAAG